MKIIIAVFFTFAMLLTGCSGIRGYGQSYSINFSGICVITNPKVTVSKFEDDLVRQLESRNLGVTVVIDRSDCEFQNILTYTALRSMGAVTKVKLSLYEKGYRVAYIDWDAGRSPMPGKISNKIINTVEFWQTAEALAGLFGEIDIE